MATVEVVSRSVFSILLRPETLRDTFFETRVLRRVALDAPAFGELLTATSDIRLPSREGRCAEPNLTLLNAGAGKPAGSGARELLSSLPAVYSCRHGRSSCR